MWMVDRLNKTAHWNRILFVVAASLSLPIYLIKRVRAMQMSIAVVARPS